MGQTQPRSAQHHYSESERLLGVAESPSIDPGLRDLSAMLALGHALLTLSPRGARRVERSARHTGNSDLPPSLRWGGIEESE